jgi:hypothetical protein
VSCVRVYVCTLCGVRPVCVCGVGSDLSTQAVRLLCAHVCQCASVRCVHASICAHTHVHTCVVEGERGGGRVEPRRGL